MCKEAAGDSPGKSVVKGHKILNRESNIFQGTNGGELLPLVLLQLSHVSLTRNKPKQQKEARRKLFFEKTEDEKRFA